MLRIKAWYYSPYVLDGLVRPDAPGNAPLRLNGGFSEDTPMDEEAGNLTDSTEEDDSMQRLPEVSLSSRPASPSVAQLANDTSRAIAGPSTARTTALRKAARSTQANGNRRSPAASKAGDDVSASHSLTKSRKEKSVQSPIKLYVCEGCFKYMVHPASYAIHSVSMLLLRFRYLIY